MLDYNIMTEKEKEKKPKEKLIINIVDGVPCIYLPPGIVGRKLPQPQVIPFNVGTVQEYRTRDVMPDILKDLKKLFKNNTWGFTRIEILDKEEDKKDDNEERERETDKGI